VIHGFSIKGFGIFLEDGVRPGKVKLVQLKADKAGVFIFSCNIICGKQHQNMKGVLIVRA
jgi:cytochrome c oxidase subunit 2